MEKSPKVAKIFECIDCNYSCTKKSDFNKHILTAKHKNNTNLNNLEQKVAKNLQIFICKNCNKIYKARNSLWYHEKVCNLNHKNNDPNESNENKESDKDLIMMLIKENSEFKNMMLKVLENGTHNTTTNSHNKTFNLNMFLNETCKNAMNITEFVDSLQLQMSDLENVGEVGYIEGISSIIIKKLNTLDITERPIHCTDKKRETMYIKDQDKWEKEDEKKTKMHKLVTKVANKNITMISEFQKLHPEWKKCSSKYADQHNKIVIESMGGKGDNEYEKQEKIIKKIAKEVFVDKGL
jgi:Txe/YoeB family toxin of Txe-Axe toxin-antitoxin module